MSSLRHSRKIRDLNSYLSPTSFFHKSHGKVYVIIDGDYKIFTTYYHIIFFFLNKFMMYSRVKNKYKIILTLTLLVFCRKPADTVRVNALSLYSFM